MDQEHLLNYWHHENKKTHTRSNLQEGGQKLSQMESTETKECNKGDNNTKI